MVYIMTTEKFFCLKPQQQQILLKENLRSVSRLPTSGVNIITQEDANAFFLAVARRLPFLPGPGPDTPFQRKCVLGSGSDRKCRERTTVTKKH